MNLYVNLKNYHLYVQGICDANSNSLHYGKMAKLNTRCFYLGIMGTKSFVWDGHYSRRMVVIPCLWLLTPVIYPKTNAKVTHIAHQKCYWEGIRFVGHVFIDWTLVEEISLVFPSKACDITVAGVYISNHIPFQDPKPRVHGFVYRGGEGVRLNERRKYLPFS